MSKDLVLRQIVAREGNCYPREIPLSSDETTVIQKFRRAGHVGSTIELQATGDGVQVVGTWRVTKVNLNGAYGNKSYVRAGHEKYGTQILSVGGNISRA